MKLFPSAHATHPQWPMAAGLVLAQLKAQLSLPTHAAQPTLGLIYITDHYADQAQDILDWLSAELPTVTDWAGTVGVGIAANNVEYFDEPALTVMLCELPHNQYRVFSGVAPLGQHMGFEPHTALVHADGHTPDVGDLIAELAQRTHGDYVFGGLASSRHATVQFAVSSGGHVRGQGAAGGVYSGGLSGVAFGPEVALVSRVTQGCVPISPAHTITECEGHLVLALDGEPALDVLLRDLKISLEQPQTALAQVRATLVGLSPGSAQALRRTGEFGDDVWVRHIVGLDPKRQGVAVAELVSTGMGLSFCQRHVNAARADLMRIGSEIREALEAPALMDDEAMGVGSAKTVADTIEPGSKRIVGAIYVSCAGRGGPHFGGPSAEMHIVRRALGDVPLVGFFAGGEIAHRHLYGYTGVLTVFTSP
jgi:small ligand-binding sensory domain FIST